MIMEHLEASAHFSEKFNQLNLAILTIVLTGINDKEKKAIS